MNMTLHKLKTIVIEVNDFRCFKRVRLHVLISINIFWQPFTDREKLIENYDRNWRNFATLTMLLKTLLNIQCCLQPEGRKKGERSRKQKLFIRVAPQCIAFAANKWPRVS